MNDDDVFFLQVHLLGKQDCHDFSNCNKVKICVLEILWKFVRLDF